MASKRCIIARGRAVTQFRKNENDKFERKKEDCFFKIQDLAWKKHRISIHKDEVSACHRLGDHSIIISFLDRKEGSTFKRLLNVNKTDYNPSIRLTFELRLIKEDREILTNAQKLIEQKKIEAAFPDATSGKITIKVDGSLKVVETQEMLDNYVAEVVDDEPFDA